MYVSVHVREYMCACVSIVYMCVLASVHVCGGIAHTCILHSFVFTFWLNEKPRFAIEAHVFIHADVPPRGHAYALPLARRGHR